MAVITNEHDEREKEKAALLRALDDSQRIMQVKGGLMYVHIESSEHQTLLAAARRDLARLEGEKPKKASLGELVKHLTTRGCACCHDRSVGWCCDGSEKMMHEAADVLRAVGEARKRTDDAGRNYELRRQITEELLRSLP